MHTQKEQDDHLPAPALCSSKFCCPQAEKRVPCVSSASVDSVEGLEEHGWEWPEERMGGARGAQVGWEGLEEQVGGLEEHEWETRVA